MAGRAAATRVRNRRDGNPGQGATTKRHMPQGKRDTSIGYEKGERTGMGHSPQHLSDEADQTWGSEGDTLRLHKIPKKGTATEKPKELSFLMANVTRDSLEARKAVFERNLISVYGPHGLSGSGRYVTRPGRGHLLFAIGTSEALSSPAELRLPAAPGALLQRQEFRFFHPLTPGRAFPIHY